MVSIASKSKNEQHMRYMYQGNDGGSEGKPIGCPDNGYDV